MTKFFTRITLLCFAVISSYSAHAVSSYAEGTWTVAARAGIAPSTLSEKVNFQSTITLAGVSYFGSVSKNFQGLYNTPFTVGADLGYFICDNLEVFGNFDYSRAGAKKVSFSNPISAFNVTQNQEWKIRDVNSCAGYIGLRQYFCPIDCFIFFAGAKLGVKGYANCSGSETYTRFQITVQGTTAPTRVFDREKNTHCAGFSGGLQWGVDWRLAECYALTFMSEMIGTSGKLFKSGLQTHRVQGTSVTASEVTKNPSGVLSFPITFGLRVSL